MGLFSRRPKKSKGQARQFAVWSNLTRRKLALLFLAFALATTADTCTDPNTGVPIPHEHTPVPAPRPTPEPPRKSDPSRPPDCPPGQIPWGVFDEWLGCMDDPNAPASPETTANPPPNGRDGSDDSNPKPGPGTYVVESETTDDGRKIVFERPPLCSTVSADTPCIEGYHQDEDGNEVWVLPPDEGTNTRDNVNSVFCGNYGDSLDHSGAPTPHAHPAPFPYDHDGNANTPDICSHSSENCAWHNTCARPRPTTNPVTPLPRPTASPQPIPPPRVKQPKACEAIWSKAERLGALKALRWESVVPYPAGFTGHHHPEVPGGELFLTAASAPDSPARHWMALSSRAGLDMVDSGKDACRWRAVAVGVSLRQLLPYYPADLNKLSLASGSAANEEAGQAAELWNRLSLERQLWYVEAFPRNDPAIVWCSPQELPLWTAPPRAVLSLPSGWGARYGKCRWHIPRHGFWEWQILVDYESEEGDLHTTVLDSDLSWFREPTGYLGEQVTLW